MTAIGAHRTAGVDVKLPFLTATVDIAVEGKRPFAVQFRAAGAKGAYKKKDRLATVLPSSLNGG